MKMLGLQTGSSALAAPAASLSPINWKALPRSPERKIATFEGVPLQTSWIVVKNMTFHIEEIIRDMNDIKFSFKAVSDSNTTHL